MLENLIKKIHESPYFGDFVEMGCGNPIAHELCKIEGASNTIFYSENPYDKDFSKNKYNIVGRFVSKETILKVMEVITSLVPPKVNFHFVSNFQVGNLNNKSTHGYIGIKIEDNKPVIYHISIHENLKREHYIDKITEIGLKLLGKMLKIEDSNIDCIDEAENLYNTINFINQSVYHNFAFIKSNGQILRLEDFLRISSKNIIIYKGSFNPIHNGHIEITNKINSLYPESSFCFSISTNTFDKKTNIQDIIERVQMINKLGYDVLIYNKPLFSDMLEVLNTKSDKKIIFPIGYDTFERLNSMTEISKLICDFVIFGRNNSPTVNYLKNVKNLDLKVGISSSDIRKRIINNLDIKDLVPLPVYLDILNKFQNRRP